METLFTTSFSCRSISLPTKRSVFPKCEDDPEKCTTSPKKITEIKDWPLSSHRMLSHLKEKWPEGRGIQEFVRILHLHKDYPAELLEQAIEQALSYGCVHLDGVLHCLRQLTDVKEPTTSLDLSDRPDLDKVGNQPVDLSRYERLLKYTW